MPEIAGLEVHRPERIFLSGLGEEGAAAHLESSSGILVSGFATVAPVRRPALVHNPDDSFVAGFTLRAHDMSLRCDGKLARRGWLPVGSVNFSHPANKMESESEGPWELLFLMLPRAIIDQVAEQAELATARPELGFFNQHGKSFPRLLALAREARGEATAPGPFSQLRADLIGQSLIVEMLLNHSSWASDLGAVASRPAHGGLSSQQLRRAFEMMDSGLDQDLTLANLASAAGCSATHFSRAFKQSTGTAPFAWLLHRRIDRAKDLLKEPSASIAEIALSVGFSAQPQFTTAFRRVTGETPAAWRRRVLQA